MFYTLLYKLKKQKILLIISVCLVIIGNVNADNRIFNQTKFIGRHQEIKTLINNINNSSIAYITGLPGVGKTELVRHYISLTKNKYDIIHWFDCGYDLIEQFFLLGNKINQTQLSNDKKALDLSGDKIIDHIISFLEKYDNNCLLVFENIRDFNELPKALKKLEKNNKNIRIIFSSLKSNFNSKEIKISNFKRSESVTKLTSYLNDDYAKEEIDYLANVLEDHPLSLESAASFIVSNRNISVTWFVNYMNDNSLKVLREKNSILPISKTFNLIFNDLKINNPRSYTLLKYTRYMYNSDISNDILMNLYFSLFNNSALDYLKDINLLLQYSLLKPLRFSEESKLNNLSDNKNKTEKMKDLEMHKLVQSTLLNYENKENSTKELKNLIRVVNEIIPEPGEVTKLMNFTDNNKSIIKNAYVILDNATKYQIVNNDTFELAVKILRIYMFKLMYSKAGELIDYLDNNVLKSSNYKPVNSRDKAFLGAYKMLKAVHYCFVSNNYEKSILELLEARNLLKDNNSYIGIKYVILCQLAQMLVYTGQLKEAGNYILELEQLLLENDIKANKGLFYFIKSKYEMESGNLRQASSSIQKGIENTKEEYPNDKFIIIPDILLYVEILIKLNQINEGYLLISDIYNNLYNELEEGHEIQSRALTTIAMAEVSKGLLEEANKHIKKAILIKKNLYSNSDDNVLIEHDDDLALSYIVYGDVMFAKNEIKKARDCFLKAIKIFHNLFKQNIEWESLAVLYKKVIIASLKMDDLYVANQYFKLLQNSFGIEHLVSKEMNIKILEYSK